MKKIVMFAGPQHEIPPTKGAAVQTWIDEVSKRIFDYQTHIISISHPFFPEKEFEKGVYYHRIKIGRSYKRIFQKILGWDVYSYNKRVFNIIKTIEPDIVHIHNYYNSKEIVSYIRRWNKKVKIVLHMHNESDKFNGKDFPEVDLFIGCSDYITGIYRENKLIKSKVFQTIYNGVDIDKFSIDKFKKDNINSIYKIDRNQLNVCFFGRISPEKGVDKFVELAKLFDSNKQISFHIFGEISKSGGRKVYADKILNIVNSISNTTIHDYIPPQKIHLAYNIADIVIVPSRFNEPFGMVALEALASKKIVISVKKGGLKEFLNNNNSFLVDDYESFSSESKKIIEQIMKNTPKIITENAYKDAKKFDWQIIANNVMQIYDKILYDRL